MFILIKYSAQIRMMLLFKGIVGLGGLHSYLYHTDAVVWVLKQEGTHSLSFVYVCVCECV